jgi:dGTPase
MSQVFGPGAETRVTGVNASTPMRVRRVSGGVRGVADSRSEASRDRDRVLYSWHWRRLGGVTQVMSPFDDVRLLHNRLTHSEKVAQVARSIAAELLNDPENHAVMTGLGGFDVDVCEAAAMAHDIGHPPFGHIGETILDGMARNTLGLPDGFEGNAQTFRIVAVGRVRSLNYEGLDLTAATLAAVAKYPWQRTPTLASDRHDAAIKNDPQYRREWRKFSVYDSEKSLLDWSRAFATTLGPKTQTLEASVMDVADDITYAVHDLEDFYFAKVLDVAAVRDDLSRCARGQKDRVFSELAERLGVDYAGWFDPALFTAALNEVEATLAGYLSERSRSAVDLREALARSGVSDLIGRYIAGVRVASTPLWENGPHIGLAQPEWHEIQVLKEITKSYVINGADLALLQRGQEHVLSELVTMLHEWTRSDPSRLPPRLRAELQLAQGQKDHGSYAGQYYKTVTGDGPLDGFMDPAPRGEPSRVIIDYICSLSDAKCTALYQKLSGQQVHRAGIEFGF